MDVQYDYDPDQVPKPMHDDKYAANITLSVFLITGLCAGLPALIWAVRSMHQELQGSGARVPVFIVSLLFSDALELLISPLVIAVLLKPNVDLPCRLVSACIATRLNGFYLHQLVALEGVLSLRNSRFSSCLSSPFISVPLSITLWMFAFNFHVNVLHSEIIFLCELTCVVAVLMCLLACKSSHSNKCTKPGIHVAVVAMVTLVFLYGPFTVNVFFSSEQWLITVSSMSLRLITDPLLCVLVCRKIIQGTITNRDRTTQRSV